ncbi:MAG: IPT/TIG domain-containing protein [Planctomycetota bacterium]
MCIATLLAAVTCLVPAPNPAGPPTVGEPPVIRSIDVTSGNMIGGTEITLLVGNVSSIEGTNVTVDDVLAEVVEFVPGVSITLLTPPIVEPTGAAVDVAVRTSDGKTVLADVFTYTPTLAVEVIGSAATGGGLLVNWQTEGLDPEALMTVWVGNPLLADFATPLPGYAGVLYEEPKLAFVSTLASEGAFLLHFPALPASIVGFPLHLQGLATKEGAHKGSFTNVATFALP